MKTTKLLMVLVCAPHAGRGPTNVQLKKQRMIKEAESFMNVG